jgi:PAS domain S-box-containing protein
MNKKLNVLVIEDTQADAELNVELLRIAGYEVYYQRVETAPAMRLAIESASWDIILSDYSMPQFSVLEALEIYHAHGSDIPFIVVSGAIGEVRAVQLIKSGAHDFLLKANMTRFISVVERELKESATRRELVLVNAALEVTEEKYRGYIDHAPDGVFIIDETGKYVEVNEAVCRNTGYSKAELLNMSITDILPEESLAISLQHLYNLVQKGESTADVMFTQKNGTRRWWTLASVKLNETRFLGFTKDITERKEMEANMIRTNNFLDLIVDNIPNMIFVKDARDLSFVRVNRALEELVGMSKTEMIGRSDFEFFPVEQASHFVDKDRETIRSKKMVDIPEEPLQTKNQGVRTLHTKKVPILNPLGEPEYLLGISEDITERRLFEHALKVSEEKYKTMLNASPDGIFLVDLTGIIKEVSEIGLALLGVDTRDELIGKNFFQFIPSDEMKTIRVIIEHTMNEGLVQNVEIKIKRKNESFFIAETSVTLIGDPKRAPVAMMVILRDISKRKSMETKQFHADRMASLGEMASGIAHEINQPLNIISLVMDSILFEFAKTQSLETGFLENKANKIFDNITRMRNIIDHIRAFSRSHSDYVLMDFDINASIENAVSMVDEQFKHHGINLELRLEKGIAKKFGNTFKFEQVILNLLGNAKDAVLEKQVIEGAGFEMMIGIHSWQEGQLLLVDVTDNGAGISSGDINNVMLPFYTTKEEGKGTGLGLSICYQIMKEMEGTIEITSDTLHGTKIRLIMDVQKKM